MFLSCFSKDKIYEAHRAHMFFDNQKNHLCLTSDVVTSLKVFYKSNLHWKNWKKNDKIFIL